MRGSQGSGTTFVRGCSARGDWVGGLCALLEEETGLHAPKNSLSRALIGAILTGAVPAGRSRRFILARRHGGTVSGQAQTTLLGEAQDSPPRCLHISFC
jgi:hypothetical protein